MSIAKYLERQAEPIVNSQLLEDSGRCYDEVLVIPACQETPLFLQQLFARQYSRSFLLILIINQPDEANGDKYSDNLKLFDHITNNFEQAGFCAEHNCYLFDAPSRQQTPEKNGILLIDRFSHGYGINRRHGVGLARKTGADAALKLISEGVIKSPWIHSTDADTQLPENYFDSTTSVDTAARICDFEHEADDSCLGLSTLLYEISLRYYVHALKHAGSPYAFFTIGSTLCFHHARYAEVRGFPKRSAGEDFYLLNKLAKTGKIIFDVNRQVTIEARFSDRVPFGTGPATQKIALFSRPIDEYTYYHPEIFSLLKITLNSFPALLENDDLLQTLDQRIQHGLEAIDFAGAVLEARKRSKTVEAFCRHMHQWFDGFRTLKYIHFLRNHYLPSINLQTMLKLGEEHDLWPGGKFLSDGQTLKTFDDIDKVNRVFKALLPGLPTNHIHPHARSGPQ